MRERTISTNPALVQAKSISRSIVIGLACWTTAILCGGYLLLTEAATPGLQSGSPTMWPTQSAIKPVAGHWTMLVFAHPKCPCTHSAFANLARTLAASTEPIDCYVLLTRPDHVGPDWCDAMIGTLTREVPGIKTYTDENGVEARRFGAATSGHAVLYDPELLLRYSGGLTASRGHEGDSIGLLAVSSLLRGESSPTHSAPVFGCSLLDSTCNARQPCKEPVQ